VVSKPAIENVPATLDSGGRVRTSKEQRKIILGEFERSGVSGAQFARQTGLKYSTLAGWLVRYRRQGVRDGSEMTIDVFPTSAARMEKLRGSGDRICERGQFFTSIEHPGLDRENAYTLSYAL
jgi:transposase-like protein